MPMLYVVLVLVGLLTTFIVLHLRSLTEDELAALSRKRRTRAISTYFACDNVRHVANRDAKKSMPSDGGYWSVDWPLSRAPAQVAALLMGKKHEWIVIGYEKDRKVDTLWMNKGFDKTSVGSFLSAEQVSRRCSASGYNSIIVFHNHPNPEGLKTGASKADLHSANEWASVLNKSNIGMVEYVCDRGFPMRYFLSAPDSFLPLTDFLDRASSENGRSWGSNLRLHVERLFA